MHPAAYIEEETPDCKCPFCTKEGGNRLLIFSADQAATHFVRASQDPELFTQLATHIRELWNADTCSLIQCPDCEGIYSWPFIGGDQRYYELAYKHAYGYPQDRWEFGKSLDTMHSEGLKLDDRCLEMGAGEGRFLKKLKENGFAGEQLWAVEYSERARDNIRQIDPAIRTVESLETIALNPDYKDGMFGYAFAFQVLEHLGEPKEFLTAINGLLKEGGLAFVSVPNPGRIRFNETNGLLLDMPPNHVSRLSFRSMEALAKRAGFQVEVGVVQPFEGAAAIRQFIAYRFKRQVQNPESVEAFLETRLPAVGAKLIGGILAAPGAVATLPRRRDGESQLFVLRKVASSRIEK